MDDSVSRTLAAVYEWCRTKGIQPDERSLDRGKAGEFDGVSIVMNRDYDADERLYYLVHALGSIVRWSRSHADVQRMFDELRDAKQEKDAAAARLEAAIAIYRAFEIESSEFAVWLLGECGGTSSVRPYTNFMRADLESMTQFHRTGKAPVWRLFFQQWNADVAAGRRAVEAFESKPIPEFRPVKTERQAILQRQD